MIRAYVMRHGSTDISPAPEGWKPLPINDLGRSQAIHAADFMQQYVRTHPRPAWGISSDLPRAEETLAVVARFLPMRIEHPTPELRAYEKSVEDPATYEQRTIAAFNSILCCHGLPFIVCHRSSTGFLAKHHKLWERNPDYALDALLLEGGILALTDAGIVPLFRAIEENWRTSGQTSRRSDQPSRSSSAP